MFFHFLLVNKIPNKQKEFQYYESFLTLPTWGSTGNVDRWNPKAVKPLVTDYASHKEDANVVDIVLLSSFQPHSTVPKPSNNFNEFLMANANGGLTAFVRKTLGSPWFNSSIPWSNII